MRVLFLTPHPEEGASSRYRVLQYLPHLERSGIQPTVSAFLSPSFYRIAYRRGRWPEKAGRFLVSSLNRLRDVARSGRYDVAFVHLEAFPVGPPWIEWLLRNRRIPIVFDLDDAIFLPRSASANPLVNWLRMPQKVGSILRWSRCVITSNDYLKTYAQRFNPNVRMIPTCLDVRQFHQPTARPGRPRPLIGWIGSHSTAPYLDALRPALLRLAARCPFTLKIVGSDRPFHLPGVEVIREPWTMATDVSSFQELDIGIYPLPSEPWVLGKCGFKTIQYMAVGVPCVVSDIGCNREIVVDGVNGFLAATEEEWVDRLSRLIVDAPLRGRLGAAGRRMVEERFAVDVHAPRLIDVLREAAGGGRAPQAQRDPAGRSGFRADRWPATVDGSGAASAQTSCEPGEP